mgnify:FL=1
MFFQFIKFCIVGGSGVFVDFGLTWFFKEVCHINKYVANSIGFICAATSNYLLNRIWTFESHDPEIVWQYARFIGISVMGLLINNAAIYLFNDRLKLNFYFSKLLAIGIVTFWNFFMNYFFTFTS